jgi:endonuclease YncB( thermonuclease family)
MQQQRERLDSSQQKKLIELYGKGNPFLRLKQSWGLVNCYPDFPLAVRNDDQEILGYLDPDWYFRSFKKDNTDLVNWGLDQRVSDLVARYSELTIQASESPRSAGRIASQLNEIKQELRSLSKDMVKMPTGWEFDSHGNIKELSPEEFYNPEKREYRYYLGAYGENQEKIAVMDMFEGGAFLLGEVSEDGETEYVTGYSTISEDLASKNRYNFPSLDKTVGLADYQNEYIDNSYSPTRQYQSMMQDWDYRAIDGRMIKAFPTYMLWLIDEGGRFAGIKLFDNLYGLNSIIDFSVSQSAADPISDTLILRLSNIYQKLTRSYKDSLIDEDDPLAETPAGKAARTIESRFNNLNSGLYDKLVELDNIRLKPGVRVHLRAGWGNNPNALQTIFNGVITEVEAGQVMTVVAQSDAIELSAFVNSQSVKGHSGKLDGAMNNFWLSEPRDLMVRLLSMGSSNFKEWLSWGSRGVLFSESRFGIRHFGSLLYPPLTQSESDGTYNLQANGYAAIQRDSETKNNGENFSALLGDSMGELTEISGLTDFYGGYALASTLAALTRALFVNNLARRDYEVFKRNIYPGNGTGIAQYMGGDLLDAGIMTTQLGSVYSNDPALSSDPINNPGNPAAPDSDLNVPSNQVGLSPEDLERNKSDINAFWRKYFESGGLSEDEFLDFISGAQAPQGIIEIESSGRGWLDDIMGSMTGFARDPIGEVFNTLDGFGIFDKVPLLRYAGSLSFGSLNPVTGMMQVGQGVYNGMFAIKNSTFGQVLGLSQIISDDDIEGFDEVAFRAQTYMKTVWDLFQTCAALLPNYIVAVRPFEDRSTVFYGKPHWLYTSGLIPVTTGVQTELQGGLPTLIEPDEVITNILNAANGTNQSLERMITAAKQTGALKDIEAFLMKSSDPFNMTGAAGQISLISKEAIIAAFQGLGERFDEREVNIMDAFDSIDYSVLTEAELSELADVVELLTDNTHHLILASLYTVFEKDFGYFGPQVKTTAETLNKEFLSGGESSASQQAFEMFISYWTKAKFALKSGSVDGDEIHDYSKLIQEIDRDSSIGSDQKTNLKKILETDPVTFAYQFGWRYSRTPVWIGPEAKSGYDVIGDLARQRYDEDHSPTVDVIAGNSGKTLSQARDIWLDFRLVYRYRPEVQEIYRRAFPFDTEGENYDAVMDTFMRFLWQDPWNRAWVVLRADLSRDGVTDTLFPSENIPYFGNDDGYYGNTTNFDGSSKTLDIGGTRTWFFDGVDGAWQRFLVSNDVKFDSKGTPVSGSTKAWMRANAQEGGTSSNVFSGAVSNVKDWFDENVGQVLGLITDSITGLIASLRLSLAQLSQGLTASGEMNRQANVLNATLMDSVYYQLGGADEPILKLVDNPFTREYNEPVIEIREPFQRVHMISSSKDILSNRIVENLNGVSTVVTAVSDGKNPVTVHFDKGVPPDRQTETIIETGIYWDNTFGGGFFGFLQPFISPLESIRGFKKTLEGSSDQLSAKRIGLYHLKNSLKNIYQGEIIVLGNTDIRPFDLVYIADSYERIFGLVEVGQVVHHFTPETGFITSITPDALVSINDPARWSMTSYLANKIMNNVVRDEARALVGIGVDRFVAQGLSGINSEDLYTQFSDHIEGAVQWTQGSTALVRDLGAIFAGGGIQGLTERDRQMANIIKLDIGIGAIRAATVAGTTTIGAVLGNVPGAAVGLGTGYAIQDLQWKAWQWVKDNILDQHGLYVQYLSKEGQPMDAGLSYFEGSAVGSNHTLSLFPSVFGIPVGSTKVQVKKDGHFRIATNDLLMSLGWTEIETLALYRDTSLFVNQINTEILTLAGRGPDGSAIDSEAFYSLTAVITRVIDGDTVEIRVLKGEGSPYPDGTTKSVRLAAINAAERASYAVESNNPNDLGDLAYQYLNNKYLDNNNNNVIAIRIKRSEREDDYERIIGTIFHNVPTSTPPSSRSRVLKSYASANPPIPMHGYLDDGRPHTLNWELVMAGYANVDMRESLWETDWRDDALGD